MEVVDQLEDLLDTVSKEEPALHDDLSIVSLLHIQVHKGLHVMGPPFQHVLCLFFMSKVLITFDFVVVLIVVLGLFLHAIGYDLAVVDRFE